MVSISFEGVNSSMWLTWEENSLDILNSDPFNPRAYQVKKTPVEGFRAFKCPILLLLCSVFLVVHFKQLAPILNKELAGLLDDCPK